MNGNLQVKNGKYYAVVSYSDTSGKYRRQWFPTGLETKGNKCKAERFLRQKIRELEGKRDHSDDILFSDYIRKWLVRKQPKVEEVTFIGYSNMARVRILPYFDSKGYYLQDINRAILQEFFDHMAQADRLDGPKGKLSAKSLQRMKNIISQSLKDAVKEDLIFSNPCDYIELPKAERHEASFYNADQLKALFKAVEGDVLEPIIKIAALYGLRRSEVLGIKWDSIDFAARRLTIKHTVLQSKVVIYSDKTKNSSSRRSFYLSDEALAIFKKAKADEEENRKLFGSSYIESDYVFKWDTGKLIRPDYISYHFRALLKKHGLPKIRFHELRHSCASMLLDSGFTLKDVQEYMGHADIQMTANIYGHLDQGRKDMLSNSLSERIF